MALYTGSQQGGGGSKKPLAVFDPQHDPAMWGRRRGRAKTVVMWDDRRKSCVIKEPEKEHGRRGP